MKAFTRQDGSQVLVKVGLIDALDCWELQRGYTEFCITDDPKYRRAFTMNVLNYATVLIEDTELPLKTDALINNHLRDWKTLQDVFHEVLIKNGINPETHAKQPNYWSKVGAEMAVSFVAEASKLIGPAFALLEEKATKKD